MVSYNEEKQGKTPSYLRSGQGINYSGSIGRKYKTATENANTLLFEQILSNPGMQIEIIDKADDICRACPFNRNDSCTATLVNPKTGNLYWRGGNSKSEKKVAQEDRYVAMLGNLKIGRAYYTDEIFAAAESINKYEENLA